MKLVSILVVIASCVIYAESGRLLTVLHQAATQAKCELHHIGTAIASHQHHNDPCKNENPVPEITGNEINPEENVNQQIGYQSTSPSSVVIDIRGGESTETPESSVSKETPVVASSTPLDHQGTTDLPTSTPEPRRIFTAGSNCPPGQISDGKGNCRDEY